MVLASHSHLHWCQRAPIAEKGNGKSRGLWGWRSQAEAAHNPPHGMRLIQRAAVGACGTLNPLAQGRLSQMMARLVSGQAEAGGSELRVWLLLGLFPKVGMFWVASATGSGECPLHWNTHGNSETQKQGVPPASLATHHPTAAGGELGHHDALPVPSCRQGKGVFVLNLVDFYNFCSNLGYVGDCRGKKKKKSTISQNERDTFKSPLYRFHWKYGMLKIKSIELPLTSA